jgi:predicted double-glycine peptidase
MSNPQQSRKVSVWQRERCGSATAIGEVEMDSGSNYDEKCFMSIVNHLKLLALVNL